MSVVLDLDSLLIRDGQRGVVSRKNRFWLEILFEDCQVLWLYSGSWLLRDRIEERLKRDGLGGKMANAVVGVERIVERHRPSIWMDANVRSVLLARDLGVARPVWLCPRGAGVVNADLFGISVIDDPQDLLEII